jgi:outer membrane protein TolC
LAACTTVGPEHVRPGVPTPAAFAEGEGWKQAAGDPPPLPERWWTVFGEPAMDALVEQVAIAKQDVAGYEALYRQAVAALAAAGAPRDPRSPPARPAPVAATRPAPRRPAPACP